VLLSQVDEPNSAEVRSEDVSGLPQRTLLTYARLWQLETWLRRMAYVELRAQKGDEWSEAVQNFEKPLQADRQMIHMPTPEDDPLSYAQFSELKQLISDNWNLFRLYLQPQTIWQAKLEEVSQIRNRVAHFRRGHSDDLQRVLQLLRDVDHGFWVFCTSYNSSEPALPASDNPVTAKFLDQDPMPWREISPKKWMRIGHAAPDLIVGVTVETLRRPWVNAPAKLADRAEGYLYNVHLSARDSRRFDYRQFLKATRHLHCRLVHLCLDRLAVSVRLTIPAVLAADTIIRIIEQAIEVAGYTVNRGPVFDLEGKSVQRLSEDWPEYILGPDNPLTFLAPDMPCTFFNV
jgi:hypothetical protein